MSDETVETRKPASLAAWKKAKFHTVRLPSSSYVEIAVPDLARLIETGHIPQNLLEAALSATGASAKQGDSEPTKDFILQEKEFSDKLVQATVTAPELKDADLGEVPFEDKVMLVEIATRQRDLDAEGSHIGGLHKSEAFRKFRGLDGFESSLED